MRFIRATLIISVLLIFLCGKNHEKVKNSSKIHSKIEKSQTASAKKNVAIAEKEVNC
jgi:hypothetical protein